MTDRTLRDVELACQLSLSLEGRPLVSPAALAGTPCKNDSDLSVGQPAGTSDRALHDRLPEATRCRKLFLVDLGAKPAGLTLQQQFDLLQEHHRVVRLPHKRSSACGSSVFLVYPS